MSLVAVSGSTAFLAALSLLATGLAVALASAWIIQHSRMESARKKLAESRVWDRVGGVAEFTTESRTQTKSAFISEVQETISALSQIPLRFVQFADQEDAIFRLRQAIPNATDLNERLRKEIESQGKFVGAISHFPIEALDDSQEALLVSYLREWKVLRDLRDRLSQEISRLSSGGGV